MNLKQQVCSLDLAKRLKELGAEQNSIFYWSVPDPSKASNKREELILSKDCEVMLCFRQADWGEKFKTVSAFTVAELGEMLPISITRSDKQKFSPVFYKNRGDFHDETRWSIEYSSYTLDNGEIEVQRVADTEADARAKMLIYLLENKLIN